MTETFHIPNRGQGFLPTIARVAFLAVAAIGGLFMIVFSAAFALFAVAGIAVIGFLIFGFFWAKAKLTGKPFGPRAMMGAQLDQMRKEMESQMGSESMSGFSKASAGSRTEASGPIVDAHQTPDGWTVDD